MKSLILVNFICISIIIFSSLNCCIASGGNVKKSVEEREDNGDTNEESKDESLDIPLETNEQQPGQSEVNTTCTRRANSQMHEIKVATSKQFPFIASIMSQQNDHLCTGTVVSNGLILTSAVCTLKPVSYVLLNATKAKKDDTTVALHVIKTDRFPTYSSLGGDKNVGLIYTEKHNNSIAAKISLSNYTSTRNVVDMELLGFGLNADVGQPKDLQYIGVENRLVPMHPTDFKDALSAYIDCIDTKVPTCFKDVGGPSIFSNELMGIVTEGDDKCFKEITSTYSINKKIAELLPTYTFKAWLEEKIKKNEEQDLVSLVTYPVQPVPSRRKMSSLSEKPSDGCTVKCPPFIEIIFTVFIIFVLF